MEAHWAIPSVACRSRRWRDGNSRSDKAGGAASGVVEHPTRYSRLQAASWRATFPTKRAICWRWSSSSRAAFLPARLGGWPAWVASSSCWPRVGTACPSSIWPTRRWPSGRRGLLNDLRSTLRDLKRAGYYLSDAVIEGACKAAESHW